MPRRIPIQVTQTVSRLMQGGYVKTPPAWYAPTLQYPPMTQAPRQPRSRPDEDLPRALRSDGPKQRKLAEIPNGRSRMNSLKKIRSQIPTLRAQPIVYDADRVRRQFFRDHPWEARRPRTLVEMDYTLETHPEPEIPAGTVPELHFWSRTNPSVEDVVQCTLRTHRDGNMSLSQAYIRTVAAYHAIQAERELRSRYAVVEARALGADMGPTETDRGFAKETAELAKWAALSNTQGAVETPSSESAAPAAKTRTKRAAPYSGGNAYLSAAAERAAGRST
ncbi:mitochondrial ribosomal small subunit component [Malassezia cuniculi]|uniref:Small ribosomal subunit protein mS23 n=1 Tax=Malassezia cuniculi TaxID=948313 RepID=A0AAF0J805_9BASI|nr:mitochondrial ribosomal small subunit component [Malassezia cuniculi]